VTIFGHVGGVAAAAFVTAAKETRCAQFGIKQYVTVNI
jgi:EamA domain-containing membrane protein RarD